MDEKYWTVKEVAAKFRVSRQAVYDWIAEGKLRAVKISERVRIPNSAVEELVRPIEPGESLEDAELGPMVPALVGI